MNIWKNNKERKLSGTKTGTEVLEKGRYSPFLRNIHVEYNYVMRERGREIERQTERDRQTDIETDRKTLGQTERERHIKTETDRQKDR